MVSIPLNKNNSLHNIQNNNNNNKHQQQQQQQHNNNRLNKLAAKPPNQRGTGPRPSRSNT